MGLRLWLEAAEVLAEVLAEMPWERVADGQRLLQRRLQTVAEGRKQLQKAASASVEQCLLRIMP